MDVKRVVAMEQQDEVMEEEDEVMEVDGSAPES